MVTEVVFRLAGRQNIFRRPSLRENIDEIGRFQRPAGEREVELAGVKRGLLAVRVKQDILIKAAVNIAGKSLYDTR
jgi:hypothetical protein